MPHRIPRGERPPSNPSAPRPARRCLPRCARRAASSSSAVRGSARLRAGRTWRPGTYATLAHGRACSRMKTSVSKPSGNVSHVNRPPCGSVKATSSGNCCANRRRASDPSCAGRPVGSSRMWRVDVVAVEIQRDRRHVERAALRVGGELQQAEALDDVRATPRPNRAAGPARGSWRSCRGRSPGPRCRGS